MVLRLHIKSIGVLQGVREKWILLKQIWIIVVSIQPGCSSLKDTMHTRAQSLRFNRAVNLFYMNTEKTHTQKKTALYLYISGDSAVEYQISEKVTHWIVLTFRLSRKLLYCRRLILWNLVDSHMKYLESYLRQQRNRTLLTVTNSTVFYIGNSMLSPVLTIEIVSFNRWETLI